MTLVLSGKPWILSSSELVFFQSCGEVWNDLTFDDKKKDDVWYLMRDEY